MSDEYRILRGDCLDRMRELDDGSVDAIVTDPPYGLAFMGAKWDTFGRDKQYGNDSMEVRRKKALDYATANKGALAFQNAMTPIFKEAMRVAKPGAHLLCFGGTRTFHRMTCAIEDAGWEIRDCIMWVYGCLDEETEILIDGEFVPYNKAKIGSLALGYDIERGTFSWQRIEDTYLYDYDDTAYAIQSDSTDQLVSRNHRCIVERGGVEQFAFAEQVAQEREACVPVLEGLQGLLDHLPLPYEGAGDEEQDLLAGVRGEGGESSAEEAQGARAEHDMPSMREGVLHTDGMEAQGQDELLLRELQEQGQVWADAVSVQQGASDPNVREAEATAQRVDDGREEPVMEGRCDVSSRAWELQGREVRQMPEGVLGDGTQGRIRDGAQACGGSGDREAVDAAGMRASHQPRPDGQQTREPDAVPVERGAQDLRESWGAKSTLARVTPTHYKGKMWCVKVRTGAFVARRHGKIFITGNSGFPKSMDVSKAIDKALGAERKKVPNPLAKKQTASIGTNAYGDYNATTEIAPEPATEQAKEWDGWGTCLKPAWEPIIVARKPLDGTVAHNVMTYGTGAINIDGCRVPTKEFIMTNGVSKEVQDRQSIYGSYGEKKTGQTAGQKLGRFPANLVHDGSQEVLELIGDAQRFFYCAKASKRDRGEGNDHPTVKPNALMRWLVRLVCPQGGTVLDPFMGSGSTGVACIQEGMRFVGIDKDKHYCDVADQRMRRELDGGIQRSMF